MQNRQFLLSQNTAYILTFSVILHGQGIFEKILFSLSLFLNQKHQL